MFFRYRLGLGLLSVSSLVLSGGITTATAGAIEPPSIQPISYQLAQAGTNHADVKPDENWIGYIRSSTDADCAIDASVSAALISNGNIDIPFDSDGKRWVLRIATNGTGGIKDDKLFEWNSLGRQSIHDGWMKASGKLSGSMYEGEFYAEITSRNAPLYCSGSIVLVRSQTPAADALRSGSDLKQIKLAAKISGRSPIPSAPISRIGKWVGFVRADEGTDCGINHRVAAAKFNGEKLTVPFHHDGTGYSFHIRPNGEGGLAGNREFSWISLGSKRLQGAQLHTAGRFNDQLFEGTFRGQELDLFIMGGDPNFGSCNGTIVLAKEQTLAAKALLAGDELGQVRLVARFGEPASTGRNTAPTSARPAREGGTVKATNPPAIDRRSASDEPAPEETVAATSPATTTPPAAKNVEVPDGKDTSFRIGQTYEKLLPLNSAGSVMQVPLPPGKWTILAVDEKAPVRNGTRMAALYLFNNVGEVTVGAAVVAFPFKNAYSGWLVPRWCRNTITHHFEGKALFDGTQTDCWGVSHAEMTTRNTTGAASQAVKYAQALGFKIPANSIYSRFNRADYGKYLVTSYYYNPEAFGMAPPQHADHRTSDYHPDRIGNYPKKKVLVDHFVAWSKEWKNAVDLGFSGGLTAATMDKFSKLKPLPGKIVQPVAGSAGTASAVKPTASIKDRLRRIKTLLDEGLISDDEAQAMRKRVLKDF